MAANPSIIESTAYEYNNQVWVGVIFNNDTQGVCRFVGGVYTGTNCILDTINSRNACIGSVTDNLKKKIFTLVDAYGFTYSCMNIYTCSSGENCGASSCTTWNSSPNTSATYIGIAAYLDVVLPSPSTLTLTPGNGTISASWSSVDSGDLWIYYVEVYDGETLVKSGYTTSVERNVTLTGLTNGKTYTVNVSAISRDDTRGNIISKQEIPSIPCVQPSCSFNVI